MATNGRLLVGASRETLLLARSLAWEPAAVVDPSLRAARWHGLAALRDDRDAVARGFDEVVLAIDAPAARDRAYTFYSDAGICIRDLLGSSPAEGTVWGAGIVIQRRSNLSTDCTVGLAARINTFGNVMHDVTLGDFVTIAPNAVLLSQVNIGRRSYVGANATLLPGISVGADCVIGAGAVVTRDVPDGATVMGNPARIA